MHIRGVPIVFRPGWWVLYIVTNLAFCMLLSFLSAFGLGTISIFDFSALTAGIIVAAATMLTMTGVICHEMGHFLAAQLVRLKCESVEFSFDGGSVYWSEPSSWRQEFVMTAGGICVSLAIVIVAFLYSVVLNSSAPVALVAYSILFFEIICLTEAMFPGGDIHMIRQLIRERPERVGT